MKISTPFDSAHQEAYLNLWRTYDRLRAIEDELFAQWDLTAQQYNVLRLLQVSGDEPVATLTLAGRLISRAPDITRMIDRLEQRGWITRERSQTDRRAVMVSITNAGLDVVQGIAEPLRQCHERQFGHLNDLELETLTDLLRRARLPHEPTDGRWA